MSDYRRLLSTSTSILLIDWPSRDVPDTLARHGFSVVAQEGESRYVQYQVVDGDVVARPLDGSPRRADIVYCHRPIAELSGIIELARELNARSVWLESGSPQARQMVEAAQMLYFDSPHIADAVREVVEL
jgi:predicted CoA-binding protein